ncbi:MAG: 2OG-Fe(II) oxygenase [Rhodospirillales bacterium]|nr:2OG-Fe(II) oxygenase [Rhodospirillales bacterium]
MSAAGIAASLLEALDKARERTQPFRHHLLHHVLPEDVARAVLALPFEPPAIGDTMGKRETHNATRRFYAGSLLAEHPVCAAIAAAMQSEGVAAALAEHTGASLVGSYLRIEDCQDTDGFWLEPHTDIGAKLFTMLIYLTDRAEADSWGTDLYDAQRHHRGTAPGGFNRGLMFVPAADTWHGVERRRFEGVRRSLIVNYVTPAWRDRHQLAWPDRPIAPMPEGWDQSEQPWGAAS